MCRQISQKFHPSLEFPRNHLDKHLSTGVEKDKGRKAAEDPKCKKEEKRKGDEEATREQNDNLLEREKDESRGDEKGLGTGESKCHLLE